MSVPVDQSDPSKSSDSPVTATSNWTINVSDIRTVKVSNISLAASEQDIKEFFSFSGDIQYVEMQRESEKSQLAYVTFKDSKGTDTAVLLSGSTIVDLSVCITPVANYQLPPEAIPANPPSTANSAVKKAEDVVSSMLAKGFVLGKDALNKARDFDERHHLTSNASATVFSLDRRIGLSEKISIGTALVNEKMRVVDERFQVSEKTRSAITLAEQKASFTGSALMKYHYISAGASLLSSALSMVAKAAEDLSQMTRVKVEKAEEEKKEIISRQRTGIINEFAHVHLDQLSTREPPMVPNDAAEEGKLGII
ncbi:binding partner of ACD11 1-like isoform X2 [Macadamia integrifolia]|uniref:binding partner of ACD11 1-like isoform X2 n=1 Tax=Macadamia integrifolia TaxID=60698 RepID=UPI001C4F0E4C|nr:binding partner of ACD11 1-like isoform X2 [Macadamia integrifolia]